MEREAEIGRPTPAWDDAPRADGDAELEALLERLPIPPGIRHIDDDSEEEDRQADADLAAGRFVPHEVVSAWLATWGDADHKPLDEWLKSSG